MFVLFSSGLNIFIICWFVQNNLKQIPVKIRIEKVEKRELRRNDLLSSRFLFIVIITINFLK